MPKTRFLLLIVLLALFLPYIALCFFAHPIADDFDPINQRIGLVNWIVSTYKGLTARYTFMAVIYLLATRSLVLYRLIAFSIISSIPASIYFLFASLVGKAFSFSEKLITALLFSLLLLAMFPSLPQGIYWLTGSSCYVLGCVVTVFYIGILVRYLQGQFILNRAFHAVLIGLVLAINIGFSEVLMTFLLAAHGLVWLLLPKEKKLKSHWLWLSVITLFFFTVVYIGPANEVRSNASTNTHLLFHSLGMAILQMVRFFFTWVAYAPLLLASLLFVNIGDRLSKHSAIFRKLASIKWWQAFTLLWVILFVCTFPPYWYTGILGQHRTLNVACFIFLPLWFLFTYIVAKNLGLRETQPLLSSKAQGLLIVLLCGCLLFSGNSGQALLEFSKGEITGFNNELNSRYALTEAAKQRGEKKVYLPALQNQPSSLFVLDLQPDCRHWINTSYAQYFGVDTVCLENSTPNPVRGK